MPGPSNVTTTTNTAPPAYLTPYLSGAASIAQRQLDRRQSEAGGQILPNSQNLVNNTIKGQFLNSGPGQGLINSTLSGDFLNSNPYLDQTFQNAANATRTQLSSEFGGAGRDLGAALPARSEQLQHLAASIYGNNYQAERDRQLSTLGQASQNYATERANQISAIDQGNTVDPLNRFINQIAGIIPGAGGSTQSTQPVFRGGLFSDRRLKRNIERIGTVKGLPWYRFEYIWGEESEGFLSDEVPKEFVSQYMGYDHVDYAGLLGALN